MGKEVVAAPPPSSGITWEDLEKRLLIIEPLELKEGLTTVHSKTPGDTTAVRSNVYARTSKTEWTEFEDTYVFPKVLQSQIRKAIGRVVVGRLVKDQARKQQGKNAPWVLADPTPADIKVAQEYLVSRSLQTAQDDAEDEGYDDDEDASAAGEDGEDAF